MTDKHLTVIGISKATPCDVHKCAKGLCYLGLFPIHHLQGLQGSQAVLAGPNL